MGQNFAVVTPAREKVGDLHAGCDAEEGQYLCRVAGSVSRTVCVAAIRRGEDGLQVLGRRRAGG